MAPHDWQEFLRTRLQSTTDSVPLGGLVASGWRLVYSDVPPAGKLDCTIRSGSRLPRTEKYWKCVHASPAARGSLFAGLKIVTVNKKPWSIDALHEAIKASKGTTAPIDLTVNDEDLTRPVSLDYHGGDRYPHLERDPSRPDLLDKILKPVTAGKAE